MMRSPAIRRALRSLAALLLVAAATPRELASQAPVATPRVTRDDVLAPVRNAITSGRLQGARWPVISDVVRDLRLVYDSAQLPLWLHEGRATPNALSIIRYLQLAEGVGLRSSDYDAAHLDSLARRLRDSTATPAMAGRFEAMLSVATARMLAALQWGRVKPSDVHESIRIPRDDYNLAAALRIIAGSSDPIGVFDEAEPPVLHYRLLKGQLARHREMARDSITAASRRRMNGRITKLELALERWRWFPHTFPGRVIIVNVPEFRLHAFDRLTSDSVVVFSMDVVVGKAYDHKTPIFTRELKHLDFSPYWEVPTSIARKEIRPPALRSPSYLQRNHYVLLRNGLQVPVTAANIDAIGNGVRVRQLPGADNALGRVKFVFPNPHSVYMHDTPVQSVFERQRRDLSHGCIRLSRPVELAKWILRDRPEWTPEAMEKAMSRSTPLTVPITERIPVYVLYVTAIAERNGTMRFFDDLYGHDRTLQSLLARGYPYPR